MPVGVVRHAIYALECGRKTVRMRKTHGGRLWLGNSFRKSEQQMQRAVCRIGQLSDYTPLPIFPF